MYIRRTQYISKPRVKDKNDKEQHRYFEGNDAILCVFRTGTLNENWT
jgi:hypothetical protein